MCCKRLIKRADVKEIIDACDAGREGELIFRNHRPLCRNEKANSAALVAIDDDGGDSDGFRHLRSEQEMQPLADAAVVARGERLAGRYQCDARSDVIQLAHGWISEDRRWPGADADADHSGRARGENT